MNNTLLATKAAGIGVTLPVDPLGTKFTTAGNIITAIMSLVFWVALAIASAHLIITGVKFASSGGDKFALQAAKKSFIWGIVGFIVVIGFRSIIALVSALLGGTTGIPNTIPNF